MRETMTLLVALLAGPSKATTVPGPDRVAMSETLFQDGKALLEQGNAGAACPKLAESLRLDRATGTLLALAMCHEVEGRLASAWAEYLEVIARATKEGRSDREEAARQYAHALEARLPTLTIAVPVAVAQLPGLTVTRDGVALEARAWTTAVPVDPGPHVVAASAPNRRAWRTTVTVDGAAHDQTITVPLLAPDRQQDRQSDRPPDSQDDRRDTSASAAGHPSRADVPVSVASAAIFGGVANGGIGPAVVAEVAAAHPTGWGGALRGAWLASQPGAAIDGGGEVALQSVVLRGSGFRVFLPTRALSLEVGPELMVQLDRAEPSGLQGAHTTWRAGVGAGVGASVDLPLTRWLAVSMLANLDYAPARWAGRLEVTHRGEVLRPPALRVLLGVGPRFALAW